MSTQREISIDRLDERISSLPGFEVVREAVELAGVRAHLVGGAVRDALLDRPTQNLDLVVEGDHLPLLERLGGPTVRHERFATAAVELGGAHVDVARARAETYSHPGALPDVRPATIERDLERRDFTINAMAVPVDDPGALLDPTGGRPDLSAGLLRVLHPRSFVDDPTRALRAARYAGRLDLDPEPATLELLEATDLETVSRERVEAELVRMAAEERPRPGFERLVSWGLLALTSDSLTLIGAVAGLLDSEPWRHFAPRVDAVLTASREPSRGARELAGADPASPSAAVALARGHDPCELAIARALGGVWLDRYVDEWAEVGLEISGDDLVAAGVAQGPAIGRGLEAALWAKLDGEAPTASEQLRIALDAAD